MSQVLLIKTTTVKNPWMLKYMEIGTSSETIDSAVNLC